MLAATTDNTYIIAAKPNTGKPASSYWHSFAAAKLGTYCSKYGNEFFLLIEGRRNSNEDFFLIPFERVSKALVPNQRWVGTIKPKDDRWVMNVRIGAGFAFDVTACRNTGPRPYR